MHGRGKNERNMGCLGLSNCLDGVLSYGVYSGTFLRRNKMDKIIVKLDEDFEEVSLFSWISHESLKTILDNLNINFYKRKPTTKITGFIITEKGIQIQKKYI